MTEAPLVPWPEPVKGAVWLRKVYRDPMGRRMSGSVTITGTKRHEDGDDIIPEAASFVVKIPEGLLNIEVPPDTYTLVAALQTREGAKSSDTCSVTLSPT